MRLIDIDKLEPYRLNEHYKYRLVYDADEVANAPTITDRPKNMIHIDDVYRLIAGHSNYHGDSILSAFTCLVEGKDVKPIAPLDESADRPTWEWIKTEHCLNDTGCRRWIEIECPYCGERPTYEFLENMNYCPNCGCLMKKGD